MIYQDVVHESYSFINVMSSMNKVRILNPSRKSTSAPTHKKVFQYRLQIMVQTTRSDEDRRPITMDLHHGIAIIVENPAIQLDQGIDPARSRRLKFRQTPIQSFNSQMDPFLSHHQDLNKIHIRINTTTMTKMARLTIQAEC